MGSRSPSGQFRILHRVSPCSHPPQRPLSPHPLRKPLCISCHRQHPACFLLCRLRGSEQRSGDPAAGPSVPGSWCRCTCWKVDGLGLWPPLTATSGSNTSHTWLGGTKKGLSPFYRWGNRGQGAKRLAQGHALPHLSAPRPGRWADVDRLCFLTPR